MGIIPPGKLGMGANHSYRDTLTVNSPVKHELEIVNPTTDNRGEGVDEYPGVQLPGHLN